MATIARERTGVAVQRGRWGVVSWVFMRVSGVLLLFLALGHFAIMHVFNDVHDLSLQFVAARWALLGWRLYDASLLALALVHGLNGLRIVVDDYVINPAANRVIKGIVLFVGAALIVLGSIAIVGGARMPS